MDYRYELFKSEQIDASDPDYIETINPLPEIRITANVKSTELLHGLVFNKDENAVAFARAVKAYIDQMIRAIDAGKLIPIANYNLQEMVHLTVNISETPSVNLRVNCATDHEEKLKNLLLYLRGKDVGAYIMDRLEQEYKTRPVTVDIKNSYKEVLEGPGE